jgi:hypothetical protein
VADVIHASITNDRMFRWVELDPAEAAGDADLALAPVGRDARWRLVIRREPEADEQ